MRIRERRLQLKRAQELLQPRQAAEGQNFFSFAQAAKIYYSKLHFDLSKSTAEESKAEYYPVKEAMGRFNLSRDAVSGVLQFHQIPREKNGRFVRFLKVEFDRVMGVKNQPRFQSGGNDAKLFVAFVFFH